MAENISQLTSRREFLESMLTAFKSGLALAVVPPATNSADYPQNKFDFVRSFYDILKNEQRFKELLDKKKPGYLEPYIYIDTIQIGDAGFAEVIYQAGPYCRMEEENLVLGFSAKKVVSHSKSYQEVYEFFTLRASHELFNDHNLGNSINVESFVAKYRRRCAGNAETRYFTEPDIGINKEAIHILSLAVAKSQK